MSRLESSAQSRSSWEIMASLYLGSDDFPVGRALQPADNGLLLLAAGTENHVLFRFCIIWMCFNGYDFI